MVPEINLQFRAPLIYFTSFLRQHFLMWGVGGGESGGGAQVAIPPLPPPPVTPGHGKRSSFVLIPVKKLLARF